MATSFSLEIPGLANARSIGQEGAVEIYIGEYSNQEVLITRAIDSVAHPAWIRNRFSEYIARYNELYEHLITSSDEYEKSALPKLILHSTHDNNHMYAMFAIPSNCHFSSSLKSIAQPLAEVDALSLTAALARLLSVAHGKHLFHCDLRPGNILTAARREAGQWRGNQLLLLGLGLFDLESAYVRATHQSPGHSSDELKFRAPELHKNPECGTESAEVYSLGRLFRVLATGGLKAAASDAGHLSEHAIKLIGEMERSDPGKRPSLADVSTRLSELISNAHRPTPRRTVHTLDTSSLARVRHGTSKDELWMRSFTAPLSKAQISVLSECKPMLALRSGPNLGRVTEWVPLASTPYLLLENPGDETLRSYVDKHGPLARQALGLIEQIARVISDWHHLGILHLSLAPENIAIEVREVSEAGSVQRRLSPSLLLAETAQLLLNSAGTRPTLNEGAIARPARGLQAFLAPEQFGAPGLLGEQADVYALGSLLFFLLTGRKPPDGMILELPAEVPLHADLRDRVLGQINTLRTRHPVNRPSLSLAMRSLTWLHAISRLLDGQVLQEQYELERPMAPGGMNALYLARHVRTRNRVVLKVPFPEFPIARTEQEILCANQAAQAHEDVVIVRDFGELAPEIPYLQMDFIQGQLLSDRLKERGGRMSEREAARIGAKIATVMERVHAVRVVHRDLKPENLMLVTDANAEGGERIKIFDFGIAKLRSGLPNDRPGVTQINSVMGTLAYMPPEQWNAASATEKSDVFALGSILQELLGGTLPIQRPLRKLASATMMKLVSEMTDAEPEGRPGMGTVAVRLRALGQPQQASVSIVILMALSILGLVIGLLVFLAIERLLGPEESLTRPLLSPSVTRGTEPAPGPQGG